MRVIEVILFVLALIAAAFHILHLDGGSTVPTLIFPGLLALFYLFFSIPLFNRKSIIFLLHKERHPDIYPSPLRIGWAVAAGIIFSLVLGGILSALQGWHLAPFFWTGGMLLAVPVGAVSLAKNMLQPAAYHRDIAIRSGILLLCGILVVVLQR